MAQHISEEFKNRNSYYTLLFNRQKKTDWWGYIWRGLLVEETGKHHKAMNRAIWLYLYLIIHADRKTGTLFRKTETIAKDMGISLRIIQKWLQRLRNTGYITSQSTGRSLNITITKWRPIKTRTTASNM